MKVVVIGDIHGRDFWKSFVEKHSGSHFVFLGDFVDPYDDNISDYDALVNLNEIIEFKKANKNNVTLIIGNHDAQYIYYPKYSTESVNHNTNLFETVKIFRANKELFQFTYQYKDNLFIHAGVTSHWFEEHYDLLTYFGLKWDNSNLGDVINDIGADNKAQKLLMGVSNLRKGSAMNGGVTWADKFEFFDDGILPNIHQYVGHNKVPNIWTDGDENGSVTFCDVLSNRKKCLVINI